MHLKATELVYLVRTQYDRVRGALPAQCFHDELGLGEPLLIHDATYRGVGNRRFAPYPPPPAQHTHKRPKEPGLGEPLLTCGATYRGSKIQDFAP